MRFILSVSVVLLILVSSGLAPAQEDKKSETPGIKEINEVGGKTIDEWVKELHSADSSHVEVAVNMIVQFPFAKAAPVLPDMIKMLQLGTLDANNRLALISGIGTIAAHDPQKVAQLPKVVELLGKSLKDPQYVVRVRAMAALAGLGAAAHDSLKDLLDELTLPVDTELRVSAISAIGTILANTPAKKRNNNGLLTRAVTVLANNTTKDQLVVRINALKALYSIGPDASAATPQIIAQLKDFKTTWEVRQIAALALGTVGYDPLFKNNLAAHTALVEALKDKCAQVRVAAIQSLGVHGVQYVVNPKNPKEYIPKPFTATTPVIVTLNSLAKNDPDPAIQISANITVMKLTLSVPIVNLNQLIELSNTKETAVSILALQSIGAIGEKAKMAVPSLISSSKHKEIGVRINALQALGAIGDKDAVPSLLKALADPVDAVKLMAIFSLSRMPTTVAPVVVPALQQLIADPKAAKTLKDAAKEAIDILEGKTKPKEKEKKK